MFIIKPEIGTNAWVVSKPQLIKNENEIYIIHFSGIIDEIDSIGNYFINNYSIPINRIAYFEFGGIIVKNDRFSEYKCMMEDRKIIKDICSKAGKQLNVNKMIEQSWWQ